MVESLLPFFSLAVRGLPTSCGVTQVGRGPRGALSCQPPVGVHLALAHTGLRGRSAGTCCESYIGPVGPGGSPRDEVPLALQSVFVRARVWSLFPFSDNPRRPLPSWSVPRHGPLRVMSADPLSAFECRRGARRAAVVPSQQCPVLGWELLTESVLGTIRGC